MLSEGLLGTSQFVVLLGSPGANLSLRTIHWLQSRSTQRRTYSTTSVQNQSYDEIPESTFLNLLSSFKNLSPNEMVEILSRPSCLASTINEVSSTTHVGRYIGISPLPVNVGLLTRKVLHSHCAGQRRNFVARKQRKPSTLGGATHTKSAEQTLQQYISERGGIFSSWLKKAKIINNPPLKIVTDEHIKKYLNTEATTTSNDEFFRARLAFLEGYIAANDGRVKNMRAASPSLFRSLLFMAISLLGVMIVLGIMTGAMSFKVMMGLDQREVKPEDIHVTFNDVKGVDEAKEELMQIVEYLRNPDRFSALGGKLPKGVLLVGPPGTGKTLLARAVAGQAGVPFFQAAGSEFDEILVGQGARRVRDLFAAAKEKAPCVIFIDEIDAVGSKRTNSVLHPHANQTINQLLAEMDGFHQTEGVIVLGATNRSEDLDRALTRPGRFDIEVHVPMPDLKGRSEILRYYLDKLILGTDVKVDVLARGTAGFTGADIENMINQAALAAASDGLKSVPMTYLEKARDKVLMGPAKKSRVPDEEANRITAYHEGGHTLVAHYTKDAMPLHKVTIIPRGPSLGHTAYLPEREMYHQKKSEMLAMLDTLMAGRAAEELIFGSDCITSGAADDLRKASELAGNMVKMYGMSDKVGLRYYGKDEDRDIFSAGKDIGANAAEAIDMEIRRILQESYERAKTILRQHGKEHRWLADALLEHETLDAEEIKQVISGQTMIKKAVL